MSASDAGEPRGSVAFDLIAQIAIALGAAPLHMKHAGCWECDIDGTWWVAVNGHTEPRKCTRGFEVPPYEAYVEFNGWPAAVIHPYGGGIVAGAAANEDMLIEALRKRLELARTL
jgi:hypothetical protein